ncbi:hypothetical protein JW868_04375 [Candidatus Woesearchaeota archaeon]|nr:hypothetical protein [Candidatus Woesearchaeota archaeon]
MSGFDEYFNIDRIPEDVQEEVIDVLKKMRSKYPEWGGSIEILRDHWPEGNAVRFNHGNLDIDALSEIDETLQNILSKHKLDFEVNSAGFTSLEED